MGYVDVVEIDSMKRMSSFLYSGSPDPLIFKSFDVEFKLNASLCG